MTPNDFHPEMKAPANIDDFLRLNRRHFFKSSATGIGGMALAGLLDKGMGAQNTIPAGLSHYAPKAKRVIYLFQSGGPA